MGRHACIVRFRPVQRQDTGRQLRQWPHQCLRQRRDVRRSVGGCVWQSDFHRRLVDADARWWPQFEFGRRVLLGGTEWRGQWTVRHHHAGERALTIVVSALLPRPLQEPVAQAARRDGSSGTSVIGYRDRMKSSTKQVLPCRNKTHLLVHRPSGSRDRKKYGHEVSTLCIQRRSVQRGHRDARVMGGSGSNSSNPCTTPLSFAVTALVSDGAVREQAASKLGARCAEACR